MKRILKTTFFLVFTFFSTFGQNQFSSPNKKILVDVGINDQQTYGKPSVTISYKEKKQSVVLFENLLVGLKTDQQNFADDLKLVSVSDSKKIKDEYTMLTGKRSKCINFANEKVFKFENRKGEVLEFVLRAYNDGVAFRYQFNTISEDEQITEEMTTYPIPEGVKRWAQTFVIGYEDFYWLSTTGKTNKEKSLWSYPLLLEPANSVYTLISEANILRDHSGSYLNNTGDDTAYRVQLYDKKLPVSGAWVSPWRVMIIGSLADIVESTLITDVSEPSKVANTDWIVPGPASWIYWAYNHSSSDYKKVIEYIDLAAEMKWPYNLIDWKWNEMGNGGTVTDALKYADDRGIKTLLWYNSCTSWIGEGAPGPMYALNAKEDRINEYQKLNKMGVSGVKIDFFNGDGYKDMNYYIDLLEDAIDYELLVNFHGATIPRGWQRTYPHMMTVEAVYGAEWYNNNRTLTNRAAKHNATLPFTRNVIGPMDYTPGTFTDSQHPHITSHGHELALYVVFESALQHMPDRPEGYRSLPVTVKDFLSNLPTAWDETKLLSGYPGENIILARRKGDAWYVAGLNGTESACTLSFKTDFIKGAKKKTCTLMKDGKEERSFDISGFSMKSVKNSTIEVECLPRGGFVCVIN